MELIKNSFYTIYLNGRKSILQGILIYMGEEWVLLKYVPVDYVLDGYLLIRTKYIRRIERGVDEVFNESVIRLKLASEKTNEEYFNLNERFDVLYYLMRNQIIIQFDFHDDSVSYIGKIKRIYTKTIRMESLNPRGEWEEENSYQLDRIRTIQFDNDYIDSLIAYSKWIKSSNQSK